MTTPPEANTTIPDLRQRQEMYLINHYLTAHVTVMSLALGVAGLAAASLISPQDPFVETRVLLGLLWLASLLATMVAYSGSVGGSIVLPPRIPTMADMIPSLLLGLCEILMFAQLAYPVTRPQSPLAVIAGWWFTFGAFGLLTAIQMRRVHRIVDPRFAEYLGKLRINIISAAVTFVFGTGVGAAYAVAAAMPAWLGYSLAGIAITGMIAALAQNSHVSQQLQRQLSSPS